MNTVFDPTKPFPVLPSTAEVVGKSELKNGVFGSSRAQTGVIGQSETFIGVSGVGKLIGVSGESGGAEGIGIHGKGGRVAGLFEGNVEIMGSLTVRGVDLDTLLQRLAQLEEQDSNLQQLVQSVEILKQNVDRLTKDVFALMTVAHNPTQ
jgi:hypothetical protein